MSARATLTARRVRRVRWQTGTSEQTARVIVGFVYGEARS